MLYTRSSVELLRRRKVRRENLYQYLAQQGHIEHPAADKNTLLKKVLKLWELKKQGVGVDNEGRKTILEGSLGFQDIQYNLTIKVAKCAAYFKKIFNIFF